LRERIEVALGAAALVAFLPQHVAILASVNNDSLAGLEIGITLIGILIYLKGGRVKPWHLGLLVGLGSLTKLSTLFLVGIVPAAILLKWWVERKARARHVVPLQPLLAALISFALPMVILGGIWSAHSMQVYGFPDVFGQRQHNLVVADQARTADRIVAIGWGEYLRQGVEITFNSFWGQFGWMALPLPGWMYAAFLGLLLVGGSGLIVSFMTRGHGSAVPLQSPEKWRRSGWLVLGLTVILAILAYLYYNTEFLQLQGRYMFSGIIPFAIGMALGVDAWRRLVLGGFAVSRWLTVGIFLLLAPLDIYLVLRVIEPLLKP
jgi:4-amino-4-deoxy-L-arabinose transferase-like glycosyltransferase